MQSRVRFTPTVFPHGRPSPRPVSTAIAVLLAALISQGCRVGPNYTPPAEPLPDAWNAQITEGLVERKSNLHTWWRTLDDPALDGLIVRAVEGNRDLRVAVGRVREARARYGFSSGNRFPDVDGVGSYERRSDKVGDFSNQQERRLTENYYGSGFDATWEIDVFGRVSRSIESAEADYQAASRTTGMSSFRCSLTLPSITFNSGRFSVDSRSYRTTSGRRRGRCGLRSIVSRLSSLANLTSGRPSRTSPVQSLSFLHFGAVSSRQSIASVC